MLLYDPALLCIVVSSLVRKHGQRGWKMLFQQGSVKLYLENFVFFLKLFTAFHILRRVHQINRQLISQIALLLHNRGRPGYEKHEAQAGSQYLSQRPLLQKEMLLMIIAHEETTQALLSNKTSGVCEQGYKQRWNRMGLLMDTNVFKCKYVWLQLNSAASWWWSHYYSA